MLDMVRAGLAKSLDGKLVDELLAAYEEMKHNFYLGGLRLSEVEGGRFAKRPSGFWNRLRWGGSRRWASS